MILNTNIIVEFALASGLASLAGNSPGASVRKQTPLAEATAAWPGKAAGVEVADRRGHAYAWKPEARTQYHFALRNAYINSAFSDSAR